MEGTADSYRDSVGLTVVCTSVYTSGTFEVSDVDT